MAKHATSHDSHDIIIRGTTNFGYIIIIGGAKNRYCPPQPIARKCKKGFLINDSDCFTYYSYPLMISY